MTTDTRPLSPNAGIYRWQITMTMSILHRITGIWLAIGTLALIYWLVSAATGPANFAAAHWFFGTWIGNVLLWLWTFALFYHLCNGIRHLFWDMGLGFRIRTFYITGYSVWIVAAVLTALAIIFAYLGGQP
ncbi:MAG: succinate dehydrogenase, cytochrome b556 subunit [Gammaproteobacteria bacterium]